MISQHFRLLRCLVCLSASAGCLATPAEGPGAPAASPQPITLQASDARELPQPLDALPRRPTLWLELPPELAAATPLLFEGPPDDELARDLERMPLTAANSARLVACDIARVEARLRITPQHTLHAGSPYTLALPHAAMGERPAGQPRGSYLRALTTARDPEAGAAVISAFPAAGSTDIPVELAYAALAFDGHVSALEQEVWLQDEHGAALPAELERVPCAQLESAAVSCMLLRPSGTLRARSRYELRTGRLLDAHDANVEPFAAAFSTGDAQAVPTVALAPLTCAVDEVAFDTAACALLGDDRIQLRLQPIGAARLRVQLGTAVISHLSGPSALELDFPVLSPNTDYALELELDAGAGPTRTLHGTLHTTTPLATLSITEIRANPLGDESAHEFVELWNFGRAPVALDGISLSDGPLVRGSQVRTTLELQPDARALLVSDAFDPSDPPDTPPATGCPLLRVGSSLTRSGLANGGEPLFLRDREGHRLSAAPAAPVPRPGVCSVRSVNDLRSGADGTFSYAAGGCTPGSER